MNSDLVCTLKSHVSLAGTSFVARANEEMCVQITKINTAQKAFQSQKELTLKAIMEHFGEAMTLGRSKATDLVALTILENIEAECKVNFPIDHLDQAESYPVDADNPIDDAAKEYKIYSTYN